MKFTELDFNPKILKALESFNFESTTQVQEQTIPLVLEGKDVTVRSETGSGKTLAYALPIIQNADKNAENVEALIICPTRELCLQVTDEIKKILGFLENIKVVPVYGGSSIERQILALKRKPQIIVGTPGRIMDHMGRRTLKIESLKTLVLDEADEMLNMGFKEDIEKILKSTPKTRQTLLFSATYPESIKHITRNYQNNPTKIEVGVENRSLASLSQYYVVVNKNSKKEALLEILNTKQPKLAIVFSNTKRMADTIATYLNENSHDAIALHGDLRQSQRKKVIDSVKLGKIEILVASDVAARGLDINDVEYVINYDVPVNVEYFIHRIGRTARIGKNGNSMTIITSNLQLKTLREYEKQTQSNIQEMNLSITEKSTAQSQNEKGEKRPSRGFSRGRKETFETKRSKDSFKKPFEKEKRPFEKTDRKPFEKFRKSDERKERKPFDKDRKPYEKKDRKPFDKDRKPYEKKDRKPFDKDRKPFDKERTSFKKDERPFQKERKVFNKKESNFSNNEDIREKKFNTKSSYEKPKKDFSKPYTKSKFSKPFEKKPYKNKTDFAKKR